MKTIKMALLAGAAIAVTTAAAKADDLDALKAQIETLNARVAAMEAAPAVPAGYSLLTVSKGEDLLTPGLEDANAPRGQAHLIQVLPTADAPAGATIAWSGQVWAALVRDTLDIDGGPNFDDLDVISRGKLVVKASTDTAVGEVGVKLDLRQRWRDREILDAPSDGKTFFDSAWGYWSVTPELTIGGGKAGTVGNVEYGIDGACTCFVTDNGIVLDPGSRSQMRLSYASGPIGLDLAVEDGDQNDGGDDLSYAGRLKYAADAFNSSINGWYLDSDDYQLGGGIGFDAGLVSLSVGAATGNALGNDFWAVSGLASAKLSDEFHIEGGVAYGEYDGDGVTSALGGVYYNPVTQLTIGVEGEWIDGDTATGSTLALVTAYSF